MRPTTICPRAIRNTGPLREKRVKDIHGGDPMTGMAAAQRISFTPEKQKKPARTNTRVLTRAGSRVAEPPSLGRVVPQLVFRHISCQYFDSATTCGTHVLAGDCLVCAFIRAVVHRGQPTSLFLPIASRESLHRNDL
jgi:hypothetical protein